MKRYKTRTGGSYLADEENKRVIMETRGPQNSSKRLTGDWQQYESLTMHGDGLLINLGDGVDEHTAPEYRNHPGAQRLVWTSPVIAVEDLDKAVLQ